MHACVCVCVRTRVWLWRLEDAPEAPRSAPSVATPCPPRCLQDLVVPLMKTPEHYRLSPLVGAPPRQRTWLAFHRGRVSRCLLPGLLGGVPPGIPAPPI